MEAPILERLARPTASIGRVLMLESLPPIRVSLGALSSMTNDLFRIGGFVQGMRLDTPLMCAVEIL